MIDANCHLQFDALWEQRDAIWSRAQQAGVTQAVVSSDVLTAERLVRLRHLHSDGRVIAAGWHPLFPRPLTALATLEKALLAEPTWGLGEVGIDTRHQPLAGQPEFLDHQMSFAAGRFCILHAVGPGSLDACYQIARAHHLRGMVHAFSGSVQQAKQWCDLGWYLSIGGPITRAHAPRLREWVAQIPAQHLLLESDAPDLPPQDWPGVSEPACLVQIAQAVAEIRGISLEQAQQLSRQNALDWLKLSA